MITLAVPPASASTFLNGAEEIAAEIVVLVENADLGVRIGRAMTCLARIRASVGYSGSPAMVHLKFFGSFHFDAPVLSISCGTPLELRYLCTAV